MSTGTTVNRFVTAEIYKVIKNGFFAIYKRSGLTSAKELEELKNSIVEGINADRTVKDQNYLLRAGHGGNLDSMATGVLAVALCDGCKVLPHLLASSKRYTVTAQMGVATDTYNNKGKVIAETGYDHVTRAKLELTLKEFVGEIWQRPPAYSALKIGGKRASDIVRLGEEVKLVPRPVICHAAHCVAFDPPFFTLDVSCGQGFYIRCLVHDLAEAVGSCGHVTALVRTKHGPFTLQDCLLPEHYSLENVIAAVEEARRRQPKLAAILDNYWKSHPRDGKRLKPEMDRSRSGRSR
uniref:tRNA pseudouridine(55) synthase n=1 Tax=Graphocephala atropunctata TaxID=36148 RepID=A0A1B6M9G7_9HEMI